MIEIKTWGFEKMPKKKKRNYEKHQPTYQFELNGLLLILIAIIGYGRYGIVGTFISSLAIFFVGALYNVLLLVLFLIGLYMIIKRDKPNLFKSKLIGLYIISIGVLVLAHTNYINTHNLLGNQVLSDIFNNFMKFTQHGSTAQGGGIIGGLFSLGFLRLFDAKGTNIVVWVLIACGFIIFTGLSIMDSLKKAVVKIRGSYNVDKHREEIVKAAETYDKNDKIVVSSVDELIHINDEKEALKKEEHKDAERQEPTNKGYVLPPLDLLSNPLKNSSKVNHDAIKDNVTTLEQVFTDFDLEGKIVAANVGPSVTQYEMEMKAGTKVSRILSIHREIALALAAKDVRIQAPIPGKKTIGIELPNKINTMVTVREILETIPKSYDESKLLVTMGRNIMGRPIYCEINNTPHLLVAGATGSGKSVCINSMIISILMRTKPDEVKLVLVDPKKVELSVYNGAPHLLAPVVTDPRKASVALKKICVEMEHRYDLFTASDTKNIAGYNMYLEKKNRNLPEEDQIKKIPYIVVIIDELADLMLVAAKEVEDSILRITQMARAAGIHLIVATQRPSTDVITGLIKANIPSRISFAVSSSIDSRTILDMMGAEKLLGKGDMLFLPTGENMPIRVQGTFISDEEIKSVVAFTIAQQKAHYDSTLLMDEEELHATSMVNDRDDYEEPLYNEIVEFILTQGKASASLLQRRFRLGYNRAARVIDLLEERGIIGPNNGSKPREVLVKLEEKE